MLKHIAISAEGTSCCDKLLPPRAAFHRYLLLLLLCAVGLRVAGLPGVSEVLLVLISSTAAAGAVSKPNIKHQPRAQGDCRCCPSRTRREIVLRLFCERINQLARRHPHSSAQREDGSPSSTWAIALPTHVRRRGGGGGVGSGGWVGEY